MNHQRQLRFQNRILLWALLAVTPGCLTAAILLWHWEAAPLLRFILLVSILLVAATGIITIRHSVIRPMQSLANLLEALREGDYSLRGRSSDPQDAIGEVMVELNLLSQMLYDERIGALEAGVLLKKVISEIDIAVFAFDDEQHLRLVNRAGEMLLGGNTESLSGRSAAELGLATMLDGPSSQIIPHMFPGGTGRWEIRHRRFREGGRPHELLVISDLSRALREEERQAWLRLVRVIGHELNSSLTPIKSMADMLLKIFERDPLPDDWRGDAQSGLTIIHDRAESLGRFMGAYARLARLPPPVRRPTDFAALVQRVAGLHGGRVTVESGPVTQLDIDPDQIEQVLINLVKNAVEAAGDSDGVKIRWRNSNDSLLTEIEDDGPGLAQTDNLWVPFFTTKPGGSGIGLVLSREIVEHHGGNITLENRTDAHGCIARISLPAG